MPKIYEYFGIIFFLGSNEHLPLHCHVKIDNTESKVELYFTRGILTDCVFKKVTGKKSIDKKYHTDIKKFIKQFGSAIALKWFQFVILKQVVANEKITTKIR